jgi:hypothetical protein
MNAVGMWRQHGPYETAASLAEDELLTSAPALLDELETWARERVEFHLGPGIGASDEQRAAYNSIYLEDGLAGWEPYRVPVDDDGEDAEVVSLAAWRANR